MKVNRLMEAVLDLLLLYYVNVYPSIGYIFIDCCNN